VKKNNKTFLKILYELSRHSSKKLLHYEKIFPLSGNGTFLILMEEPIFTNYKGKLKNGDRILFYSDGVIENFNEYIGINDKENPNDLKNIIFLT
jgi:serine phosphatase RsbU (regulator of sigma subunit)